MSDAKTPYSRAAKEYMNKVSESEIDQDRVRRAQARKAQYNDQWIGLSVNVNDLVDTYTPGAEGKVRGYKYTWDNTLYRVKADMITGTVRVFDKTAKMHVTRDGEPSKDDALTHFKIMKRKDM